MGERDIMTKNKFFIIFVATIFLNFSLNNISFAIENSGDTGLKCSYPDYAYEFCGKDKCENFNRKIFIFNSKVNKYVIRPINRVYASIMPKYGMERIQNACNNLEFPVRFVSCLVQKDFKASRQEAVRFFTNTTLGIGGLYDPAKDKFKIEPHQEDMSQALAYRHVKQGPYIVLPIVTSGNTRDIVGQILDCPLNPSLYVMGPISMAVKAVSLLNKTTYLQPMVKMIDFTYADSYDITKKLIGIEKYIKNTNLDREEVFKEKIASQNIVRVKDVPEDSALKPILRVSLNPDIELNNYNPQDPIIDAMRTALFEQQNSNDSIWSELSVWNRTFDKKIKTASVNVDVKRPNYKYRYILQKDKTAPLAILYPSFGEGIMAHHSGVLANILYDEGYSVAILGSAFQWEFAKSMPEGYHPGFPSEDAKYLRIVTSKIVSDLQVKKACNFNKKILIGTSFGGLTGLFVAAKEETENTLGISNYISICPPIEILFSLKQLDKFSREGVSNPTDIKLSAAITAEKIIQIAQTKSDRQSNNKPEKMVNNKVSPKSEILPSETLPFTEDEAKLITGFIMKQKLSDLVFTMENASKSRKSDIYEKINNMSFNDYAKKYLLIDNYISVEQLRYDTSLYSLANFLQTNKNYKIYHSIDDYYANQEQLTWLKNISNQKSVFFSNGSHLGFLYRKEFLDEFKKDTMLQPVAQKSGLEPEIQLDLESNKKPELAPIVKPGL